MDTMRPARIEAHRYSEEMHKSYSTKDFVRVESLNSHHWTSSVVDMRSPTYRSKIKYGETINQHHIIKLQIKIVVSKY